MIDSEIRPPQPDRLVPVNFAIDPRVELRTRLREPRIEPGYPPLEARMKMTLKESKAWVDHGADYRRVRREPSFPKHPLGINAVFDHPNYLDGLRRGTVIRDNGEQVFPSGIFPNSMLPGEKLFDSRGVPVIPYYDIVLEEGAAVGPAQYWHEGANGSVTAITPVIYEGKLYTPAVTRHGQLLLPGGFVDPKEHPTWSSFRETGEEAVGDLHSPYMDRDLDAVRKDFDVFDSDPRILATGRTTLNAWEETKSGMFVPKGLELDIRKHPLRPGDDIARAGGEAFWLPLNRVTLDKLFKAHANDARAAIIKYEDTYRKRIASDGTVHDFIK